jgi:DNA-binding SARP family transcriptional activator
VKNERALPLDGKRLRMLLAVLILHAREVRTADQLVDGMWGDAAPVAARASLHNMVSSLRRSLGRDRIETLPSGYVFVIDDDELDASRFERLVARADEEPLADKVRVLENAMGLWRGSPLVDVRYEEFAQSEIRRLEELRVTALEELLATKLGLGAGKTVVPELQRLVEDHPLRERLRMQLMTALHRSGRTVEALGTYVDWRRTLAATWGLEPGPDIQQLFEHIRAPGIRLTSPVGVLAG